MITHSQPGVFQETEQQRLVDLAGWYVSDQLDFDKRLIRYGYQTIRPYLVGPEGLELGSAEGQMTQLLLPHFDRLTIVDGAEKLLELIPASPTLVKVHSLFEEFQPQQSFNTIVMEHILEHVAEPVRLLHQASEWLSDRGRICLGVPNGLSIHRLVAVKMGLLADSCELNARDQALGHRRVYTPATLRRDIEAAGLTLLHLEGVFFKPLTNQQMQDTWTDQMIEGFYQLGREFPEHAAELHAVCVRGH